MSREPREFGRLIFCSDAMAELCRLARRAAATDLPVLIQGETGTGKELLARAIHASSARHRQAFLALNCGALADGLLQSELFGHRRGAFTGAVNDRMGLFCAADGGTVLLDEISDVSAPVQASLLRFLEEGEIKPLGCDHPRISNVRTIAASNRSLVRAVGEGSFRRDLYYRLCGFELEIPPLRERPEDIPVLAQHLARRYAESIHRHVCGIAPEALRRLQLRAFPGNVRELENEICRMVALAEDGEALSERHLSPDPGHPGATGSDGRPAFACGKGNLKQQVESLEVYLLSQSLVEHNWNHSRAARALGLSRVGLANKIRRYRLDHRQEPEPPGV